MEFKHGMEDLVDGEDVEVLGEHLGTVAEQAQETCATDQNAVDVAELEEEPEEERNQLQSTRISWTRNLTVSCRSANLSNRNLVSG